MKYPQWLTTLTTIIAQVAALESSLAKVTSDVINDCGDEPAPASGLKLDVPGLPLYFVKDRFPPEAPSFLRALSAPGLLEGTVAIQTATIGAPSAPKM